MALRYKKRPGTSGIGGHLYETKLISLVLFRLLHDDCVEDFYLATNMADVGAFDDICLKIKIVGHDRPVVLFIQLKHKDRDSKRLTLDRENDLIKHIDSILKIKMKLNSKKDCDQLFNGVSADTDYVFILYTNARLHVDVNTEFERSYDTVLNNLLVTSSRLGCRPQFPAQHVEDYSEKYLQVDLKLLAMHFAKFLSEKANRSLNIMNDPYLQQYHVILRQYVVQVSDVITDDDRPDIRWRTLSFQEEFFRTNNRHMELFSEYLYKEILKEQPKIRNNNGKIGPLEEELLSIFLADPSATTLNPPNASDIVLKHNQYNVEVLQQVINEAVIVARTSVIKYLKSLKLKVPTTFGNMDVAISGSSKRIESRLKYLMTAIVNICQRYEQKGSLRIVTIDDAIDSGLLSLNGGLASSVGNLLNVDKETNLLKFSNAFTLGQRNAEFLYKKLAARIDNLHEYRFDVKTVKFPKVYLDVSNIVREFLGNLVIYTDQKSHSEVEDILKREISDRYKSHQYSINSNSVFLHYHDDVLKWWTASDMNTYITKSSKLFEQAIYNTAMEPQLSALRTTFYVTNARCSWLSFSEHSAKWMELPQGLCNMFIVTDTYTLTTIKVIQCLKNYYSIENYTVLDLEYAFTLAAAEFSLLEAELRKTEKVIIIVGYNSDSTSIKRIRLGKLARATNERKVIFITNCVFIENVKLFFSSTEVEFKDETQSLTAMTLESQKAVRKCTTILFQNQEVSLDLLIDDTSVAFIKGEVLDKIIHNETINIGTSLNNVSYEKVKNLYIERNIIDESDNDNAERVRIFHDIKDDVVLVTAAPGMGKSTLLTHLSLNTKQRYMKLWIVRVNFLDHSKQFHKWYEDETVIDSLEALTFLCQVAVRNKGMAFIIEIINDEAHLVQSSGSEIATFELNMFLHYYNKKRLIFVFDGFDEICPHYKDKVTNFLQVASLYLRKNRMWVTSRPYSDILPDLKRVLGRCFYVEHFSLAEQQTYLNNFWCQNLKFGEFNNIQFDNLQAFISKTVHWISEAEEWLCRIYCIFYDIISPYLLQAQTGDTEIRRLKTIYKYKWTQFTLTEANTFSSIPLILYFIADYFLNTVNNAGNLSTSLNIHDMYGMFIQNKLKKIVFQDKNKMDIHNPDIIMKFERELAICLTIHKRLAAYALLQDSIFREFNFEEFKDMDPISEGGQEELDALLSDVKRGADKSGLISHVTADNVPVFIHRSFTEYFAAGYICDKLKSDKIIAHHKRLWFNAVQECCGVAILQWVYKKEERDRELHNIISSIMKEEPRVVFSAPYYKYLVLKNMPKSHYVRILSSTLEDYDSDMCLEGGNDDEDYCRKLQNYIISKMKPHLKQHFVPKSNQTRNVFKRVVRVLKLKTKKC